MFCSNYILSKDFEILFLRHWVRFMACQIFYFSLRQLFYELWFYLYIETTFLKVLSLWTSILNSISNFTTFPIHQLVGGMYLGPNPLIRKKFIKKFLKCSFCNTWLYGGLTSWTNHHPEQPVLNNSTSSICLKPSSLSDKGS